MSQLDAWRRLELGVGVENAMLSVGDALEITVDVRPDEVDQFAVLTGDSAPHHLSDDYMQGSPYGGRIAHGLHVLALTGGLTSVALEQTGRRGVTYGYDRVRFVKAVLPGCSVRLEYIVVTVDSAADRITGQITGYLEDGTVCLVATHILQLQ